VRFYTGQHRFYCGVDLHARTMHLCILDRDGQVVFDRNLAAGPDRFLHAVAAFRDGLAVGAECMFAWYWLADFCHAERPVLQEARLCSQPRRDERRAALHRP
jgi:hypothetical protein